MRSFARTFAALACVFALAGCGAATSGWSEPAHAPGSAYVGLDARAVAARVASGDSSPEAGEALRAFGPPGLDAVLAAYDRAVAANAPTVTRERLARAADVAARQRDAIHDRVYWYTDLEEAKRAAQAQHKPILSLRMLGRLDQDLSCANSRFFRTTLYPNQQVASRMRDGYILHWSSERPVPVVTIDFGDGRIVHRTITGNSIHYVLDEQGRVVDAIPGLYGPTAFAGALDAARALALVTTKLAEPERQRQLASMHGLDVDNARKVWSLRAAAVGYAGAAPRETPQFAAANGQAAAIPALIAIPMAAPKMAVEMPIARAITTDLPTKDDVTAVPWGLMSMDTRGDVKLDDHARAVMRAKAPLDWSRGKPTPLDDAGFAKLVDAYEAHVAEDMIKNELYFRAQIRKWLAADPEMSLTALNERVYSELFLTPASDPWLGLVPPVVYTGIQGDGF